MVIGTIAARITLNPVILGVLNGAGVIVAGIGKKKLQEKDWNESNCLHNHWKKVLVELRSALRGDEFNKNEFIDKMKLIGEMMTDETPLADRFVKKYNHKWGDCIPPNPSAAKFKYSNHRVKWLQQLLNM